MEQALEHEMSILMLPVTLHKFLLKGEESGCLIDEKMGGQSSEIKIYMHLFGMAGFGVRVSQMYR